MRRLLFCSYASGSAVEDWVPQVQGVDVAAVCYRGKTGRIRDVAKFHAEVPDYKIPNFLLLLDRFPEILEYDQFIFLDDDLTLAPTALVQLCDDMERLELDLAQPTLTATSAKSWKHLQHIPGVRVAPTNYVEIQCFAMNRAFFRASLPYFYMAKSGVGLDFAFAWLVERHGFRSAALHSIQMHHPARREADTVRGTISDFRNDTDRRLQRIAFSFGEEKNIRRLVTRVRVAGIVAYPWIALRLWWVGFVHHILHPAYRALRRFARRRLRAKAFPKVGFTERELSCFRSLVRGREYLEYGSGTVTDLAGELATTVVSVESDRGTFEKAQREASKKVTLLCRPPDRTYRPSETTAESSFAEADRNDGDANTFASYVTAPPRRVYDVVLLDGQARLHCARYLVEAGLIGPDSVVLVHDFDRPWYQAIQFWFEVVETVDRLAVLRPRNRTAAEQGVA